jgi:hypothetical protein
VERKEDSLSKLEVKHWKKKGDKLFLTIPVEVYEDEFQD